jgi:hypothetical protein
VLFAFRCRDQLGTALYPIPSLIEDGMMLSTIDPLIAAGVVLATAATDAVYVMFTSAVVARHRLSAATWSSIWYLLSSFAVIHYTVELALCRVRGGRLLDRRLRVAEFPEPASAAAAVATAAAVLNNACPRTRRRGGTLVS